MTDIDNWMRREGITKPPTPEEAAKESVDSITRIVSDTLRTFPNGHMIGKKEYWELWHYVKEKVESEA